MKSCIIVAGIFAALLLACAGRADAWNITVDTNPAPVQITNVMAIPLNNHVQWAECVSFVNTSPKLIVAVQFDVALTTVFNDPIVDNRGDRTGNFAQGITIDGPANVDDYNIGVRGGSFGGANQKIQNCWTVYLTQGQPGAGTAYVSKVLWADGTTWKHGDPWPPATP